MMNPKILNFQKRFLMSAIKMTKQIMIMTMGEIEIMIIYENVCIERIFNINIQIIYVMGNKSLEEKLDIEFIRSLEDKNFGEIQLYQKTQIEFIMKKTFTFANHDQHAETLKKYIGFHSDNKHVVLASLYHMSNTKQKNLCIEYEKIEIYIEYYNYTFDNIIQDKKILQTNELWYLLNLLCDFAVLLEKNNIKGKHFLLQNVFVSLNGIPKIYLFNNIAYYSDEEEQQYTPIQYIAMLILSLGLNKRVTVNHLIEKQLLELQNRSKQLKEIIQSMLNKQQYTLQNVLAQIDALINSQKIKLSTCLKLTKYKVLINQSNNNRSSLQQVPIPTQNKNQSLRATGSFNNTNLMKELEQKKSENEVLQKKLKSRMEAILGKQNIKISRSSTNSDKKTQRKNLPPVNWSKISTNKKKVYI